MHLRSPKLMSVAGAAITVAIATAGCGSSGGSAGGGGGGGSAKAGSAYTIGVPMPETGASAQAGTEIFDAEKLAADQVNAAGGVLGHKLQLNEQDDACDPQTAASAASKLVSAGVQAFVGNYCSGAALAAEPIVARAGLPNLQPSANDPSLTAGHVNDVFLLDPNSSGDATEATAFFSNVEHVKKVIIADDQSTFGVSVANSADQDFKAAGITVPSVQAVPATQTDFSSVISVIKSSGAQGVYWTGYYAQAALFAKQLRAAGLSNVLFVGADSTVDPAFIQDAGAAGNGTYATIVATSQFLHGANASKFTQQYQSQFHSAPGPYSAYGYDAINTLVAAIKSAHSTSPSKVIAALRSIHLAGLTGPISFASDGARQGAKFVVLEVKNGAYTLAPHQP
jgi:branched-chain amino acid transport system substrate-binding protein